MHVAFKCPGCARLYRVAGDFSGKGARCLCGEEFIIPRPLAEDAAAASVGENSERIFSSMNEPISENELPESSVVADLGISSDEYESDKLDTLGSDEPDSADDFDTSDSSLLDAGNDELLISDDDEPESVFGDFNDPINVDELEGDATNPVVEDTGISSDGDEKLIGDSDESSCDIESSEDDEFIEDEAGTASDGKSYVVIRIVTAIAAAAVVAAMFLPVWPSGAIASSSAGAPINAANGLELFADGGQTNPLSYLALGSSVLAAMLGLAAILRIRLGMLLGIILVLVSVGAGLAGLLPALEESSGLSDPVALYTQYFPQKLETVATQVPGMLSFLGGLALLLVSGLICSFGAFRKQSAGNAVAVMPRKSVAVIKKPAVVVSPKPAAVISGNDDDVLLDDAEDIGDTANEFASDETILDADISEVSDDGFDVVEDDIEDAAFEDSADSFDITEESADDEVDDGYAEEESADSSESAKPSLSAGSPFKKKISKKKAKKKVKKIGMKKK